jgi:hypothetical protein
MTTKQKYVWLGGVLAGVLLVSDPAGAQIVLGEGRPDAAPTRVADPAATAKDQRPMGGTGTYGKF